MLPPNFPWAEVICGLALGSFFGGVALGCYSRIDDDPEQARGPEPVESEAPPRPPS